jgi:nitrite reductase (NADH) large subunit
MTRSDDLIGVAADTSGGERRSVIVVVGHGMVGQRFLESAVERGLHVSHRLVLIGEESRPAYDRVHLSSFFDGATADDLALTTKAWLADHDISATFGRRAVAIDIAAKSVTTEAGETAIYDHLVLATGSVPFVPPVPGTDAPGVFVYRTIDDLEATQAWCASRTTAGTAGRGVVVGGGLLGLEAANALRLLGLETHVVEFAPRLMPLQLDEGGSKLLRRKIEALGISVHCNRAAGGVEVDTATGAVSGLLFADGSRLDADVVVFSAGIRPRDELGRTSELVIGERGGIVIDDACLTSDPAISAIGEVACHRGRVYGLVGPGYTMASVAAAQLAGSVETTFEGADTSTKLKLIGVDVASFGDAHAAAEGAEELIYSDPRAGVYKKLVVDGTSGRVTGGVLVGDTSAFTALVEMAKGVMRTPRQPESLIVPAAAGKASGAVGLTVDALPEAATICSCHNVTKGSICSAVRDDGIDDLSMLKACTKAGTGCGSCVQVVKELLTFEMRKAGREVNNHLCEHFPFSRQELFDVVRIKQIVTFSELITGHGRGRGCEICKPAVASMLASLGGGYILDGEQASLQDTNDHHLANIQRDGTYSVVPRVPGGVITSDQLIVLGEVARDFDLYSKITGGQRVDLFGAHVDQLPEIWGRLIAAGFESGHAYGKALRTVKSCVGSTWCRFGVQDSVSFAVRLELRYRGLRAPHKIKMAVSGCARECAEAQSKDVGVIATELGYNLYVGGNGGMRPQHAVLLAADLDEDTLVRYVDRFFAYYIRTADRLERTASWMNKLDGGLDHVRAVVVDDSLGLANELEAMIARHVETYECEWSATLADPIRLAKFRPVVVESPVGSDGWVSVALLGSLPADRGMAVRVGDAEVAMFRITGSTGLGDGDRVVALDDRDPFSGTAVLARGVIGDRAGELKVASPVYKQSFSLQTGQCLDDPAVSVDVHETRVVESPGGAMVEVRLVVRSREPLNAPTIEELPLGAAAGQ